MQHTVEDIVPRRSPKIARVFLSFFQNSFFVDSPNRYPLAIAAIFNSILWILAISKIRGGNHPMPLYFNVLSGIIFIGPAQLFLRLPIIGLLLLTVNAALGRMLYAREKFLGTLLCYASLVAQLLLLAAVISIIALNS